MVRKLEYGIIWINRRSIGPAIPMKCRVYKEYSVYQSGENYKIIHNNSGLSVHTRRNRKEAELFCIYLGNNMKEKWDGKNEIPKSIIDENCKWLNSFLNELLCKIDFKCINFLS